MNAQNIVSILSDLIANNLTVTQKSLITSQERQMAEDLADTVKLMTSGQKIDYVEETTLDFACYTDDEEEEEFMLDEKESEEMDEDWKDKEVALEKYNLRSFSEEFMYQVIDFVDYAGPGSKHAKCWKAIHHRFRTIPAKCYISHFRKYLKHHGTKRQKIQDLDSLVYKKLVDARQKNLVVRDLGIQRWGFKIAKEIKFEGFHASHGWLENFKNRHRFTSLKITNFVSHYQVENREVIEKSKQKFWSLKMCHLTLNHLKFLIQTKQVSKKNYTPVVLSLSLVKKGLLQLFSRKMLLHTLTLYSQLSH